MISCVDVHAIILVLYWLRPALSCTQTCSFFQTSFEVSQFFVCLSSDVDMAKMRLDLAFASSFIHYVSFASGFKCVPFTYFHESFLTNKACICIFQVSKLSLPKGSMRILAILIFLYNLRLVVLHKHLFHEATHATNTLLFFYHQFDAFCLRLVLLHKQTFFTELHKQRTLFFSRPAFVFSRCRNYLCPRALCVY